ncbi:MAG: chloride channel protein [Bacteroidetes bacterium]|nr:chloride channel protein [Bacteroidota bacterium]
MLVGITAGLAAVILKLLVHYISFAATYDYHIPHQYVFYLVLPSLGILLTVFFVKKVLKGKLGRGNANVLHAIAKKGARLPADQMYSHVITSALTVGFGGSAGLESPILTTGAAIGSNFGKTYHLTYKDRTLLLACGAAAGIAAAFNAPIAGVLFAMEVLLADVTLSTFIPLIIAAATGALLSKIILAEDILFLFPMQKPFNWHNTHWYILLGILAGFISLYYSRIYPKVEGFFRARKRFTYMNALIGGIILGLLIWVFPSLYGEGYASIKTLSGPHPTDLFRNSLFNSYSGNIWFVLAFFTAIMLIKVFATAITVGSGGNGGNFAPALFVGAYLGFVFSTLLNHLQVADIPVSNFALVAMAGILSGVFHSPLTGIFLIAEITGGYGLMIPLMIVSALSFSVVRYFEQFSMDTKKLASKGHIFTANKDRNILSRLKVPKILETDFQKVDPAMKLRDFVNVIAHSHRNIFPVVDKEGTLLGIILLDQIREIMFRNELYDTVNAQQLMRSPAAIIQPDDDMFMVMKKFDDTGAWNLPVIENGAYIGFISKSSIFSRYREVLIRNTSE